jgi:hypothetical protein
LVSNAFWGQFDLPTVISPIPVLALPDWTKSMKQLLEIKPSQSQRVMDLVNDAGVDVSDWVNFREGPKPKRSASNPKYCYEWAFIESGKVIVLNLWHEHMQERNGAIVHEAGKRRLNFSTFTTKECLNFPVAIYYHFDINTYIDFYDWKTQCSIVTNIESRFPIGGTKASNSCHYASLIALTS